MEGRQKVAKFRY